MRKLLLFTVSFALADLLTVLLLSDRAALILGAAALLCASAALLPRRKALRRAAVICLGLGVGLLWCAGYRAVFLRPAMDADGKTMNVTARIADYPAATKYGCSVTAELSLGGRSCRSVLYLDEAYSTLEPGDTVRGKMALAYSSGELSEGDSLYYRSRGIVLTARAVCAPAVTKGSGRALRDAPVRFARLLRQTARTLFPQDAYGLVAALLTGDRAGLTEGQICDLTDSGIYHTVAVSGMHVSILLGVILLLCPTRPALASAIGIPAVVFFVLMTGGTPSAVRAGCMQLILLLAPVFGRENDPPTSLAAALLYLLAVNPWSAFNVGLQLSFASIAGIWLFAGRIQAPIAGSRWYRKLSSFRPARWLFSAMLAAFSCSLASLPFSLPLTVWHFGVVSLAAPLTNVLALWAITLIFAGGLLICLLGLVCAPAALGSAWLLSWLVRWVLLISGSLARLPFAAVGTENRYLVFWLVFFWLFLLAAALAPRRVLRPVGLACLCGTLALSLLLSGLDYGAPDFTFTALDVGQGACLVFRCGGETTVVDCGGSDPVEAGERAARFLTAAGELRVDTLVLTHYDLDHAGGAEQLLSRVRVGRIVLPAQADEFGVKDALLRRAAQRGCEVTELTEDETLPLPGGELRLFAPVSEKSENDSGICVLASAGEYDILITGDLDAAGEYRLMSLHSLPDAECLVAGHHGSAGSTSEALLEAVRPETVLVSVGENRYGQPSGEALARIRAAGAQILRTDLCGTITIRG